jgi:hypothetical protein
MITAATVAAGIGLISAAVGGAWTWYNNRNTAQNTPAMQAAQANQKAVTAEDNVAKDVQSFDTTATQEDLR